MDHIPCKNCPALTFDPKIGQPCTVKINELRDEITRVAEKLEVTEKARVAAIEAGDKERGIARGAERIRAEAFKAACEAKADTERLKREIVEWSNLLDAARRTIEKFKEKQKRAWAETARFREEVVELKRRLKELEERDAPDEE